MRTNDQEDDDRCRCRMNPEPQRFGLQDEGAAVDDDETAEKYCRSAFSGKAKPAARIVAYNNI